MKLTNGHKRQIKWFIVTIIAGNMPAMIVRCFKWRDPIIITPEYIVMHIAAFIAMCIIFNYREWSHFKEQE